MSINHLLQVYSPGSPKYASAASLLASRQLHAGEEESVCRARSSGAGGEPTSETQPWGFHPWGLVVLALSGDMAWLVQVKHFGRG